MIKPFYTFLLAISVFVAEPGAQAQSKYDKEVKQNIGRYSFKYAKTSNQEAMTLYKSGIYLIDVTGQPDKKERLREGLKRLERAIQLDPTFAAAHVGLGDAYRNMVVFNLYEEQDPKKPKRMELLGEAKRQYLKALELDPANPDAHRELAFISDNPVERLQHLKEAVKVDPEQPIADMDRAHIAESEGDIRAAFNFLIEDLSRYPSDMRCRIVTKPPVASYGWKYFEKKYPEQYEAFVEKVCKDEGLPPFIQFGE